MWFYQFGFKTFYHWNFLSSEGTNHFLKLINILSIIPSVGHLWDFQIFGLENFGRFGPIILEFQTSGPNDFYIQLTVTWKEIMTLLLSSRLFMLTISLLLIVTVSIIKKYGALRISANREAGKKYTKKVYSNLR